MSNMGMRRKTTNVDKINAKHEAIDDSHASRLTPHRVSSLMSRTQWLIARLGEVADLDLGKMLDQKKNKGIPRKYLANIDVRWGAFNFDNLKEMPFRDSEFERYGLRYGDIVMCEGGEPGRCAIWKEQIPGMMYQKALHRIRPHDELDFRFLYYHFLLLGRKNGFAGLFTGSTIKHMPKDKLALVEIPLPPLPVQRRIADILSAYDDLIENNRRRISILEETARLAYRKWFGGANTAHTATLGDLLEVIESGARPKGGAVTDGVPSIGAEKIEAIGIYDFTSEKYISREYYEKMRRGKIRSGDVLLYKDGAYTGKVSMALNGFPHSEAAVNEHVFILRTSDLKTQCYLYCFLRQPEIYEKINTIASAKSCQPGLNQADVLGMEIEVCSEAKIDQFGGVVIDLFGQIVNIAKQSAALAAARDMLLPRLMKGEMNV